MWTPISIPDPERPNASRFVDEDFNRVWRDEVLEDPERSSELRPRRAVHPYLLTASLLLDIDSMQHATAPLMLAGPEKKGRIGARWPVSRHRGPSTPDMPPGGLHEDGESRLIRTCCWWNRGQHWERGAVPGDTDGARFLRRRRGPGDGRHRC